MSYHTALCLRVVSAFQYMQPNILTRPFLTLGTRQASPRESDEPSVTLLKELMSLTTLDASEDIPHNAQPRLPFRLQAKFKVLVQQCFCTSSSV